MTKPFLCLRRLRITKSGRSVYDQSFHLGVNVIHGENGSGKSSVSDAIFYALGGQLDSWKTAAATCDEVQAEVQTLNGSLTIKRHIGTPNAPVQMFIGTMEDAGVHALDGWRSFPLKRSENHESFSQILFKAAGMPEARSDGASNITMHQVLRLLYSDQRTPAAFLFRYESFDTREIREAVGDLLCGISGYEYYENELKLRDANRQLQDLKRRLTALLAAFSDAELLEEGRIVKRVEELRALSVSVAEEIQRATEGAVTPELNEYFRARNGAAEKIRDWTAKVDAAEEKVQLDELEVAELKKFIDYLEDLQRKLEKTESSAEIIGSIDFTHCPSCLKSLGSATEGGGCVLCGQALDPEREQSKYLQIRLDLQIQVRESRQLLAERDADLARNRKRVRETRSEYRSLVAEYSIKYQLSSSPAESYVAERHRQLGKIDKELSQLDKLREVAMEIDQKQKEVLNLEGTVSKLDARQKALTASASSRRAKAMTALSESVKHMLKRDLERQDEFKNAQKVELNFRDNSILVDGHLNFAESSNVIVKNAAILALLFAGLGDEDFLHPRFVLLDNIEDKGMEEERSHNFQDLIVEMSGRLKGDHQIIFTTSKLSPRIDQKLYVIGRGYSSEQRTLEF